MRTMEVMRESMFWYWACTEGMLYTAASLRSHYML